MSPYRIDSTALSVQAKEKVLDFIGATPLSPDGKLPREEELARIVGVSRITLRTALNELAVAGIISRRHGHGTFVTAAARNMSTTLNPVAEFVDMITASGYSPEVRVLETRILDQGGAMAERLGRPPTTPLVLTRKLFLADGKFCSLCVDYFALDLIGGPSQLADLSLYHDSVFRYLADKAGRHVARDYVQISAVSGRSARAEASGDPLVPSGPLLLLEGLNYAEDDQPLILAREYVDTEIITFSLIRQRTVRYR